MKSFFNIKTLSQASGVLPETIRFYEKMQLIPPVQRGSNGYRQFQQQHLEQLKFIKTCRSLGFDLQEIKTLLTLQENPHDDCRDANELATKHLDKVNQKIAELENIRSLLKRMVNCHQHDVEHCLVINTLKQETAERESAV